MNQPHSGDFKYHDDDCRCGEVGRYCARDTSCWSCCGACKEDSACTEPETHPTFWQHPCHGQTVERYQGVWPVYRSNEEIAKIYEEWKKRAQR